MMNTIRTACWLALTPLVVAAADVGQWTNVRTLQSGDRIGIVQTNQKRLEGRFASAGDSEITIETAGSITVAKSDVVRVYRHRGMSRTKKVLIGTAIGAAAGGIVAGAISQKSNDEGFFGASSGGPAIGISLAGGAGIGAGVGAILGRGYETIYQRPVSGK